MNQVVLDLETQRSFEDVGGRSNLSDLGVSVVGVYSYRDGEFHIFSEAEIPKLEELLSSAPRVIGFNIRRFDFPVLQAYLRRVKLANLPYLDILEEVENRLGHRVKLESVAQATLGRGKAGSGLDAIRFYRSGEILKLKEYCLEDVRITQEIYEFGKKQGKVLYTSRDGGAKELQVKWTDPKPSPNLSLF